MNRHFVSVKVDREERPDLDAVYMEAVQAATGRGGWPMSVFATPEGLAVLLPARTSPIVPATGCRHFAKCSRPSSRPGTRGVHDVVGQARTLAAAVAGRLEPPEPLDGRRAGARGRRRSCRGEAAERLSSIFDPRDGGFGSAPKFPQPLLLDLLLRDHLRNGEGVSLDIVERTLEAMASGGIYDHLGGGFSRYSVDPHWDVPHFEKMLYDQALIARVYLHAWQLDGDPRWLQVLTETLSYVLGDLRDAGRRAVRGGGRGLRGRGGPLLRVVGRGADRGARARSGRGGGRVVRRHCEEGNFEGRTVLHRARRRRSAAATARSRPPGPSSSQRGPVASGRASTTRSSPSGTP